MTPCDLVQRSTEVYMMPATQQKSARNRRKQISPWWSSLTRDRLGIFALTLFVLGLILLLIPMGALQGVGGIVFGTGLTVLVSTWSNRQQLAKDANLRRKAEVYGPLHAELQTLRERLEETQAGSKPYLQWIDVPGMQSPRALQLLNEEPPTLHRWSEFKADYRSLDFSESIRQLLNQTLQLAKDYNTTIQIAREASSAILAPLIKVAITQTANSAEFHQWHKEHSDTTRGNEGVRYNPASPQDWFVRIGLAQSTPAPPPVEQVWATVWLETGAVGNYQPATLGWLVAGNIAQTVRSIYDVCATPVGSYPPPPLTWIQAILDEGWQSLEGHPIYLAVRTLHEDLFTQVFQAETKLVDKLRSIQDVYEGGPPPL